MGDHGGWQHDQPVYQELIHVPLVTRFSSNEFAGRRISTPMPLLGITPTNLDAVNDPLDPHTLSGHCLMPLIRDEASFGDEMRVMSIRGNKKNDVKRYKECRGDLNMSVLRVI